MIDSEGEKDFVRFSYRGHYVLLRNALAIACSSLFLDINESAAPVLT